MKEIQLTRGKVALVDDEDFASLVQHKWAALLSPYGYWYAHRNTKSKGKQQTIYMHRQIMSAPKGVLVDHIDHDSLNNQKSNLRLASVSQNQANSKRVTRSKSGYRGVKRNARINRWEARIVLTKDGVKKQTYLGSFVTPEEAAKRYDQAAMQCFGEFARTNFPCECDRHT